MEFAHFSRVIRVHALHNANGLPIAFALPSPCHGRPSSTVTPRPQNPNASTLRLSAYIPHRAYPPLSVSCHSPSLCTTCMGMSLVPPAFVPTVRMCPPLVDHHDNDAHSTPSHASRAPSMRPGPHPCVLGPIHVSWAPSTCPGPIHASHPHRRIQPPPTHSRPHAHGMCCCPPALYFLLTHADQPPALYTCHSSFLASPFAHSCPLPRTACPAPLYAPFNACQTRRVPMVPTLTPHQTSSSVRTRTQHAGECADAARRPLHEDPAVAHVLVPGAPSTHVPPPTL